MFYTLIERNEHTHKVPTQSSINVKNTLFKACTSRINNEVVGPIIFPITYLFQD
jgi:hypothetical protein